MIRVSVFLAVLAFVLGSVPSAAQPVFLSDSEEGDGKPILEVLDPESQLCHFTVQLAALDEAGAASGLVDSLATRGVPNTYLIEEAGWHRVCAGRFELYVEAALAKEDLEAQSGIKGFVRRLPGPIPVAKSAGERALPLAAAYPRPAGSKVSLRHEELAKRDVYRTLEALDTPQDRPRYRAALLKELEGLPPGDPLGGYCELNLGILAMREGDPGEALGHFEAVLASDSCALDVHRVMALRRVGFLLHSRGDRLGAYRVYCQMEAEGSGSATLATAITEKLGLLMELAESGKGSHREVREAYRQWAPAIPGQNVRAAAVADLIYLESFGRQPAPENARAAALGERFLAHYGGMGENAPLREVASGLYQTAMFHRRAGNLDRAIELYEQVLQEVPADAEQFRGLNPHAQALIGFAHIAKASGNRQLAEDIRQDVLRAFPEDDIARRILRNSPELRSSTVADTPAAGGGLP